MERELIMDPLLDQVVGGVDCFLTKFKKDDSSEVQEYLNLVNTSSTK